VSGPLPALRRTLELMPSPLEESPGLLVRDPFRYAEGVLILPPPLVPCLLLFDGRHDESDLRDALEQITGAAEVERLVGHIVGTLSGGGFLEDGVFADMRDRKHSAFAQETSRAAVHAGAAYPSDPEELRTLLARYLEEAPRPPASARDGVLVGIAVPHVSPEGGWRSYGAGYSMLSPAHRDRTFIVLGTSHHGDAERFGLTAKPFQTPLGLTTTDDGLVRRIAAAAGEAACIEDYCHAVEHSIEFQVVFLQHLYGPHVRVVPILCGPFARATLTGGRPEDDPGVARMLEGLRGIGADDRDRVLWVAGVDMAHVGRRYGDRFDAEAGEGPLAEVEAADRARCARLSAADAGGFWAAVQRGGDPLRWCGASPLYTLLQAARPSGGALLHYEQWNIDARSVVSCGALALTA
jgi:AmmeMemoRadiSam system protein B